MSDRVFIAGASVRSAAQSAVRAGWAVFAADMFCDRDLDECGRAVRITGYHDLLGAAMSEPPCCWFYTGGLENEPELVDGISRYHRLCGNAGSVLRRVRDPWTLADAFRSSGIRYPEPRRGWPTGATGVWLCKPIRGCGGLGIRRFVLRGTDRRRRDEAMEGPDGLPLSYYQPWVQGLSHSAVYVAAGERAVLLGVTRQLVGSRWAGAGRFQYAGSIGPLSLSDPHIREFRRIGDCLARHFSLRGLFGVDTVVAGDAVWVIEVNPRFCASNEVFERATGMPCVSIHMDACRDGTLPETPGIAGGTCHGKAILFASEPAEVTPAFESLLRTMSQAAPWPALADLPPSNAVFRRGQPVLTVFADGATPREVLRNLRHRAEQLRSALSAPADVRRRRKR